MSKSLLSVTFVLAMVILHPYVASAHCDALDGPVVIAARTAFERNDVSLVLRWVPAEHEADIRAAFDRAVAVGANGGEAKALAETWFFETLVRVHRAGEGAPFDGLKPAGHIEPFVAAVDRSLRTDAPNEVIDSVSAHVTQGIRDRFVRARDAKARADHDVAAGRAYVAAYVDYLHYVEALLGASSSPAAVHEAPLVGGHGHQR
ncbi:MAG: hypothetical protein KJ066_19975 [Acidobacteria bacterium]|nr:hypothetical protein [Acidobacteriota bacterium]